ncbi:MULTISPECIES: hypothetical protein [Helcococcus]|uniref:Uncharacterized protein n=1 Tax=Helcococcus bovis TaxID=3153252 RepID=A0ABW9F9P1_9FIRM
MRERDSIKNRKKMRINRIKKSNSLFRNFPIFKGILLILFIVVLIISYNIYSFNTLKSNVDSFNAEIGTNSKFIGVVDDKYYKVEGDKLHAFNINGEIFSLQATNIVGTYYDKYVYIFTKTGNILMLDRNNGKEKKSVKINSEIKNVKVKNSQIQLFNDSTIIIMDKNLNELKKIDKLKNPVSYSYEGDRESIIEMNLNNGVISSTITIKNKGTTQFSISTANEVFLDTFISGDNNILVSNSYIYLINGNTIMKKIFLTDISSFDYDYQKLAVADGKRIKIYDNSLKEIDDKEIGIDAESVSIRKNTIVALGKSSVKVYENGNIIEEPIKDLKGWYSNNQAFYTIFDNRIDKIKAY